MNPLIEPLLRLQEVDSDILILKESLRLRPRELEDERRKVEEAQRALESLQAQVKRLRMESDRRELDVKKCDSEIEKLQVARNQTKSNQEYAIFQEQIKRQEELRDQGEEEVLQKLTEIDGLEANRKVLVEKLGQETAVLHKKETQVEAALKDMREQLAKFEAKRAELSGSIDKENLKTYERVFARHNNFAVACVEGQVCQGCFISVTTQEVNLLMQGQFIQCKSCSRILYLP